MFVDQSGNHCFLICKDSILYSNFYTYALQPILIEEPDRKPQPARSFSCLDIQYFLQQDKTFFELVAVTAMGEIYYGGFKFDS